MRRSRAPLRWFSVGAALLRWPFSWWRTRPAHPKRILVLHHLLLGDTLMLTGLLAKLRRNHPEAEIVMTVAPAYARLYEARPYGVLAHAFDPRDMSTVRTLLQRPPFDLAILPADNRWSWLARAIGVRWIVAFAGDKPAHKNWPIDELVPYSTRPTAFVETAMILEPGAAPPRYSKDQWPAPRCDDAPLVTTPCAVLHVGASSPLKQWDAQRWRAVADALAQRGLAILWTCGPGEGALVDAVAPRAGEQTFAGNLPLAALWHVIARASVLVAPDTGVAHLGRIIGTPTVTLFGPGSALVCGPGEFLSAMPYRAVTEEPFECRDQRIQFFREIEWVRRCERLYGAGSDQCARARCMEAISVGAVVSAIDELIGHPAPVISRANS